MNKCKQCGEPINMQIFGMPDDICWGCLNSDNVDEVLELNLEVDDNKQIER